MSPFHISPIRLMAKGGNTRSNKKSSKKAAHHHQDDDLMDDEIDAFHKQMDVVPLDINDDNAESDEDDEHPVFDIKGVNGGDDNDEDEDEFEDDTQLTGLAAKIARQQKYLRGKSGGAEDETHEEAEDKEEKKGIWGRRKGDYYTADNVDFEIMSSDDEIAAEEAEVLRLQKEKVGSLSMADLGLEEDVSEDESEGEPTMEELLVKGKTTSKASKKKETQDEIGSAYEEVKKDLNALSREDQMDVVYSSAPELVGLLSELNEALDQLENKVDPLLSKVEEREQATKGGMHYIELKKLLLLSYCQAITFYLLLKSEGQPVRDHPVIARLVEIKNLLDKMKKLDEHLPTDLDRILEKEHSSEIMLREDNAVESKSLAKDKPSMVSAKKQEVPHEALELVNGNSLKDSVNKVAKRKHENDQVGLQSVNMLKVRAALEEKLKQKGVFSSIAPKRDVTRKNLQPVNGHLETMDDFDDDAIVVDARLSNSKLTQLVTNTKKAKVISGDDDLPTRDDIGERRRRHELLVLAGAGIKSDDYYEANEESDHEINPDEMEEDGEAHSDSDLEFYHQVEKQQAAKLASKDAKYSRNPSTPTLPEEDLVDGKRNISYQMEKNRGLTRSRKKSTKNPRKKYKEKHKKWEERRKGQVRAVKTPSGPYGGEISGINSGISRSIRFQN